MCRRCFSSTAWNRKSPNSLCYAAVLRREKNTADCHFMLPVQLFFRGRSLCKAMQKKVGRKDRGCFAAYYVGWFPLLLKPLTSFVLIWPCCSWHHGVSTPALNFSISLSQPQCLASLKKRARMGRCRRQSFQSLKSIYVPTSSKGKYMITTHTMQPCPDSVRMLEQGNIRNCSFSLPVKQRMRKGAC